MKELVVLSGKGGTGKTTIAAALAHLASQEAEVVFVDADVDASNLELLLTPERTESHEFIAGKVAQIDQSACTKCGICQQTCRFDAISLNDGQYGVDEIACEGCSSCFYVCPAEAVAMKDEAAGQWSRSETRFGPLFHAHVFEGKENSGQLVTLVKERGRELARWKNLEYLLVDGPPGIGCPVIAACSQANLALLVTEPTVMGVHDLERILATTEHFRVPALVCVNKHDLNPSRCTEIERFCDARQIEVAGRIPFDVQVTRAMLQGTTVTEWAGSEEGGKEPGSDLLYNELTEIWSKLQRAMSSKGEVVH